MLINYALRQPFYPDAALALDFVRGMYRVGAGAGYVPTFASLAGLTVTRASIGYAERSDGSLVQFANNIARITDKGLLVEETRTNLLLRSGDLTPSPWSAQQATLATSAVAAPDPTQTATQVVEAAVSNRHVVFQPYTGTVAAATRSIYLKAGTTRYVQIQASYAGTTGFGVVVDLQTGAVTTTNNLGTPTGTGYAVTPGPNGWYRVSVTMTDAALTCYFIIAGSNGPTPSYDGNGNPTYAGSTSNYFYAWGAQLEQGQSFATSYIQTTSAAATRAADDPQLTFAAAAFPLTFIAEAQYANPLGETVPRLVAGDNTGDNNVPLSVQVSGSKVAVWNGTAELIGPADTALAGRTMRMGSVLTAGGRVVTSSGLAPTSDANVNPLPTTLRLARGQSVNTFLNAYLRRLIVYPTAFSNAQLQAATQ